MAVVNENSPDLHGPNPNPNPDPGTTTDQTTTTDVTHLTQPGRMQRTQEPENRTADKQESIENSRIFGVDIMERQAALLSMSSNLMSRSSASQAAAQLAAERVQLNIFDELSTSNKRKKGGASRFTVFERQMLIDASMDPDAGQAETILLQKVQELAAAQEGLSQSMQASLNNLVAEVNQSISARLNIGDRTAENEGNIEAVVDGILNKDEYQELEAEHPELFAEIRESLISIYRSAVEINPLSHPVPGVDQVLAGMNGQQFIAFPEALQLARHLYPAMQAHNFTGSEGQLAEIIHLIGKEVEGGRPIDTDQLSRMLEDMLTRGNPDPQAMMQLLDVKMVLMDLAVRINAAHGQFDPVDLRLLPDLTVAADQSEDRYFRVDTIAELHADIERLGLRIAHARLSGNEDLAYELRTQVIHQILEDNQHLVVSREQYDSLVDMLQAAETNAWNRVETQLETAANLIDRVTELSERRAQIMVILESDVDPTADREMINLNDEEKEKFRQELADVEKALGDLIGFNGQEPTVAYQEVMEQLPELFDRSKEGNMYDLQQAVHDEAYKHTSDNFENALSIIYRLEAFISDDTADYSAVGTVLYQADLSPENFEQLCRIYDRRHPDRRNLREQLTEGPPGTGTIGPLYDLIEGNRTDHVCAMLEAYLRKKEELKPDEKREVFILIALSTDSELETINQTLMERSTDEEPAGLEVCLAELGGARYRTYVSARRRGDVIAANAAALDICIENNPENPQPLRELLLSMGAEDAAAAMAKYEEEYGQRLAEYVAEKGGTINQELLVALRTGEQLKVNAELVLQYLGYHGHRLDVHGLNRFLETLSPKARREVFGEITRYLEEHQEELGIEIDPAVADLEPAILAAVFLERYPTRQHAEILLNLFKEGEGCGPVEPEQLITALHLASRRQELVISIAELSERIGELRAILDDSDGPSLASEMGEEQEARLRGELERREASLRRRTSDDGSYLFEDYQEVYEAYPELLDPESSESITILQTEGFEQGRLEIAQVDASINEALEKVEAAIAEEPIDYVSIVVALYEADLDWGFSKIFDARFEAAHPEFSPSLRQQVMSLMPDGDAGLGQVNVMFFGHDKGKVISQLLMRYGEYPDRHNSELTRALLAVISDEDMEFIDAQLAEREEGPRTFDELLFAIGGDNLQDYFAAVQRGDTAAAEAIDLENQILLNPRNSAGLIEFFASLDPTAAQALIAKHEEVYPGRLASYIRDTATDRDKHLLELYRTGTEFQIHSEATLRLIGVRGGEIDIQALNTFLGTLPETRREEVLRAVANYINTNHEGLGVQLNVAANDLHVGHLGSFLLEQSRGDMEKARMLVNLFQDGPMSAAELETELALLDRRAGFVQEVLDLEKRRAELQALLEPFEKADDDGHTNFAQRVSEDFEQKTREDLEKIEADLIKLVGDESTEAEAESKALLERFPDMLDRSKPGNLIVLREQVREPAAERVTVLLTPESSESIQSLAERIVAMRNNPDSDRSELTRMIFDARLSAPMFRALEAEFARLQPGAGLRSVLVDLVPREQRLRGNALATGDRGLYIIRGIDAMREPGAEFDINQARMLVGSATPHDIIQMEKRLAGFEPPMTLRTYLQQLNDPELVRLAEALKQGDLATVAAVNMKYLMAEEQEASRTVAEYLIKLGPDLAHDAMQRSMEIYGSELDQFIESANSRDKHLLLAFQDGNLQTIKQEMVLRSLGLRGGPVDPRGLNQFLSNCEPAERQQLLQFAQRTVETNADGFNLPVGSPAGELGAGQLGTYLYRALGNDMEKARLVVNLFGNGEDKGPLAPLDFEMKMQSIGTMDARIRTLEGVVNTGTLGGEDLLQRLAGMNLSQEEYVALFAEYGRRHPEHNLRSVLAARVTPADRQSLDMLLQGKRGEFLAERLIVLGTQQASEQREQVVGVYLRNATKEDIEAAEAHFKARQGEDADFFAAVETCGGEEMKDIALAIKSDNQALVNAVFFRILAEKHHDTPIALINRLQGMPQGDRQAALTAFEEKYGKSLEDFMAEKIDRNGEEEARFDYPARRLVRHLENGSEAKILECRLDYALGLPGGKPNIVLLNQILSELSPEQRRAAFDAATRWAEGLEVPRSQSERHENRREHGALIGELMRYSEDRAHIEKCLSLFTDGPMTQEDLQNYVQDRERAQRLLPELAGLLQGGDFRGDTVGATLIAKIPNEQTFELLRAQFNEKFGDEAGPFDGKDLRKILFEKAGEDAGLEHVLRGDRMAYAEHLVRSFSSRTSGRFDPNNAEHVKQARQISEVLTIIGAPQELPEKLAELNTLLTADGGDSLSDRLEFIGGAETKDLFVAIQTRDVITVNAITFKNILEADSTQLLKYLQQLPPEIRQQAAERFEERYDISLADYISQEVGEPPEARIEPRDRHLIRAYLQGTQADIERERVLRGLGLRGGNLDERDLNLVLLSVSPERRRELLLEASAYAREHYAGIINNSELLRKLPAPTGDPTVHLRNIVLVKSGGLVGGDAVHASRVLSMFNQPQNPQLLDLYMRAYETTRERDPLYNGLADEFNSKIRTNIMLSNGVIRNINSTIDELNSASNYLNPFSHLTGLRSAQHRILENDRELLKEYDEQYDKLREARDSALASAKNAERLEDEALAHIWDGRVADGVSSLREANRHYDDLQDTLNSPAARSMPDVSRWMKESREISRDLEAVVRSCDQWRDTMIATTAGVVIMVASGGTASPLVVGLIVTAAYTPVIAYDAYVELQNGKGWGEVLLNAGLRTGNVFLSAWGGASIASLGYNMVGQQAARQASTHVVGEAAEFVAKDGAETISKEAVKRLLAEAAEEGGEQAVKETIRQLQRQFGREIAETVIVRAPNWIGREVTTRAGQQLLTNLSDDAVITTFRQVAPRLGGGTLAPFDWDFSNSTAETPELEWPDEKKEKEDDELRDMNQRRNRTTEPEILFPLRVGEEEEDKITPITPIVVPGAGDSGDNQPEDVQNQPFGPETPLIAAEPVPEGVDIDVQVPTAPAPDDDLEDNIPEITARPSTPSGEAPPVVPTPGNEPGAGDPPAPGNGGETVGNTDPEDNEPEDPPEPAEDEGPSGEEEGRPPATNRGEEPGDPTRRRNQEGEESRQAPPANNTQPNNERTQEGEEKEEGDSEEEDKPTGEEESRENNRSTPGNENDNSTNNSRERETNRRNSSRNNGRGNQSGSEDNNTNNLPPNITNPVTTPPAATPEASSGKQEEGNGLTVGLQPMQDGINGYTIAQAQEALQALNLGLEAIGLPPVPESVLDNYRQSESTPGAESTANSQTVRLQQGTPTAVATPGAESTAQPTAVATPGAESTANSQTIRLQEGTPTAVATPGAESTAQPTAVATPGAESTAQPTAVATPGAESTAQPTALATPGAESTANSQTVRLQQGTPTAVATPGAESTVQPAAVASPGAESTAQPTAVATPGAESTAQPTAVATPGAESTANSQTVRLQQGTATGVATPGAESTAQPTAVATPGAESTAQPTAVATPGAESTAQPTAVATPGAESTANSQTVRLQQGTPTAVAMPGAESTAQPAAVATPGAESMAQPTGVATPGAESTAQPTAVATPGAESVVMPQATMTPGVESTVAPQATSSTVFIQTPQGTVQARGQGITDANQTSQTTTIAQSQGISGVETSRQSSTLQVNTTTTSVNLEQSSTSIATFNSQSQAQESAASQTMTAGAESQQQTATTQSVMNSAQEVGQQQGTPARQEELTVQATGTEVKGQEQEVSSAQSAFTVASQSDRQQQSTVSTVNLQQAGRMTVSTANSQETVAAQQSVDASPSGAEQTFATQSRAVTGKRDEEVFASPAEASARENTSAKTEASQAFQSPDSQAVSGQRSSTQKQVAAEQQATATDAQFDAGLQSPQSTPEQEQPFRIKILKKSIPTEQAEKLSQASTGGVQRVNLKSSAARPEPTERVTEISTTASTTQEKELKALSKQESEDDIFADSETEKEITSSQKKVAAREDQQTATEVSPETSAVKALSAIVEELEEETEAEEESENTKATKRGKNTGKEIDPRLLAALEELEAEAEGEADEEAEAEEEAEKVAIALEVEDEEALELKKKKRRRKLTNQEERDLALLRQFMLIHLQDILNAKNRKMKIKLLIEKFGLDVDIELLDLLDLEELLAELIEEAEREAKGLEKKKEAVAPLEVEPMARTVAQPETNASEPEKEDAAPAKKTRADLLREARGESPEVETPPGEEVPKKREVVTPSRKTSSGKLSKAELYRQLKEKKKGNS